MRSRLRFTARARPDRALLTDGLIREEPDNPFFYELKGQILFENGRVEEFVGNYKKANEFCRISALLRQAYGHALLESQRSGHARPRHPAIAGIQSAGGPFPIGLAFPGLRLGTQGGTDAKIPHWKAWRPMRWPKKPYRQGAIKPRGELAERAMKALPKGSPYWLRAQDIKLIHQTIGTDEKKKSG